MITIKNFRNEPRHRLASLSCPIISRPHWDFPRKSQANAWPIRWAEFSAAEAATVENIPIYLSVSRPIALHGWRAQSALVYLIFAGALSGVTTLTPRTYRTWNAFFLLFYYSCCCVACANTSFKIQQVSSFFWRLFLLFSRRFFELVSETSDNY